MERGKSLIFTVTNDLVFDQRMQRICTSLTHAGYKVLLVGRRLSQSPELPAYPFKTSRMRCLFTKGKLFYAEYNIRLFFLLLFRSFDAVCAIDLDTILPCLLVSKLKRKLIIYDAHEYFTEVPEVIRRPGIQALWRKIETYAVPKTDGRYTVSKGLALLFEARYHLPFEVIRNLPASHKVVGNTSLWDVPRDKRIVLYQGALNEGRGLELMIEAIADIDGAEFWLAGEGDLSQELRMLAVAKAPGKVKFLGRLAPEVLQQLTPKAFIGYNMLEDKGLSYYHSLSNKFFDYVQAGIPSISCHFPEYEALIAQYHCGVLVHYNKEDLVNHIKMLLNDGPYYLNLKENCHIAASELNWETEEKRLMEFYESI